MTEQYKEPIYYDMSTVPEAAPRDLALLRRMVPVRFNVLELQRRFRCVHCGDLVWPEDGGADLLPFGCSDCWARAAAVLRAEGVAI